MKIRAQGADNAAFDEEAGPITDAQTESEFWIIRVHPLFIQSRRYNAKKLYIFLEKERKKNSFTSSDSNKFWELQIY